MSVPRIALLVIDDRGFTRESLASFHDRALKATLCEMVLVDDRAHERGFCGAIQRGWELLRASSAEFDYVWHAESDFLYRREFNVTHMAELLDWRADIAQVSLRRGAHGSEPAGGFLEQWPDEFTDADHLGRAYLEHRLWFTTNPSIYRRSLIEHEWPDAPACENTFGQQLIAEGLSFACWGKRTDAPWVEHVGLTREGHSY